MNKLLSFAKFFIKVLFFKEIIIKEQIRIKKKWMGTKHAGFYACIDDLNSNSIVLSFGIGEDISFDQELIKETSCKIFGFDPTPKSINFIKERMPLHNFSFYEYGIYRIDGEIEFNLPKNENFVSGSIVNSKNHNKVILVPVKTFKSIISDLGITSIDILKMDIEGAEYEVIDQILGSNVQIKQILIEFHHRFRSIGIKSTITAIRKLNKFGYKIFGISESKMEYSFILKP